MAKIPHRILTAKRLVFVVALGILLGLGALVPSAGAKFGGITVEVVSSGCRDGEPYLELLVTNKSSTTYVLAAVGILAANGETAEVITGGAGYYFLQPQSTATFSPAFPEAFEGQTVTPYVRLYPYYAKDIVYGSPTTMPTCPGSPTTVQPPGPTETTIPVTTVPGETTTTAATETTVAPTTTAAPTSTFIP